MEKKLGKTHNQKRSSGNLSTKKKSPKVSIIIPVYNVEKYLKNCLNSILAQTFTDWEAVCVNDGSPDKSEEILKQYAQKDGRFKVISQNNQGLSINYVD